MITSRSLARLVTIYLANNIDYSVHTFSAEDLGEGFYKISTGATVKLGTPSGVPSALMSYHATLEEAVAYVENTLQLERNRLNRRIDNIDRHVVKMKLGLTEAP